MQVIGRLINNRGMLVINIKEHERTFSVQLEPGPPDRTLQRFTASYEFPEDGTILSVSLLHEEMTVGISKAVHLLEKLLPHFSLITFSHNGG